MLHGLAIYQFTIEKQQKSRIVSSKDKIDKRVNQIIRRPKNYIEFQEQIDQICKNKHLELNRMWEETGKINFITLLEHKLSHVNDYINTHVPEGGSVKEFKIQKSKEKRLETDENRHKLNLFYLNRSEYKREFREKHRRLKEDYLKNKTISIGKCSQTVWSP